MCLASTDPGGPRRCSGDARVALRRARAAVEALEQRRDNLLAFQRPLVGCGQIPSYDVTPTPPPPYHLWEQINEGHYGCIRISPDGTRAVKELFPGLDGEAGEFGPHEVELAITMGELGHSPRVHRATNSHLEMDLLSGQPLWASYKPEEDEPVMTSAQTRKLAAALKDLHRLGYCHGDLHVRQVLIAGDEVKLVDFGSARPLSERPVKCLHDLNKVAALANWADDEVSEDPYIRVLNKHLNRYRDVKGVSKAAHELRQTIALDYLQELEELP